MIKFEYTDGKGKITQRECLILKEPREDYLMLDTADMTHCNIKYTTTIIANKNAEYKAFLKDIGAKYRTFKPSRMKITS